VPVDRCTPLNMPGEIIRLVGQQPPGGVAAIVTAARGGQPRPVTLAPESGQPESPGHGAAARRAVGGESSSASASVELWHLTKLPGEWLPGRSRTTAAYRARPTHLAHK
jgi:hypothetical protein